MYIPCQIMDTSSLESQATSVALLRGLCCPCSSSSSRHRHNTRNRPPTRDTFQRDLEDPEMVFSRHRAAVIAGHRFLSNHDGVWNLESMGPPLPNDGPPPLPPRKLSSFFPPMEPFKVRRDSGVSSSPQLTETREEQDVLKNCRLSKKEQRKKRASPPTAETPPPLGSLRITKKTGQLVPHGSSPTIACPYLSPIDVAATSWEWDFGNNETLRSHFGRTTDSPSDSASHRVNIWGDPPVVKKGLLKQQREKMWSRWKERYFILTRDYLHCFRRLRNVYRLHVTLSAMGQFIYKLRLANIEDIRWDTFRTVARIALTVRHEATIYLRSSDDNVEALYHWYTLLQECICMSKIRRQALRIFNSSSEEDTSSGSDPSRMSGALTHDHLSHHSSYTLPTSSPLSASSGHSDIHEIYKRVGSYYASTENTKSEQKLDVAQIGRKLQESIRILPFVHEQPRTGSTTSCGFYLAERPQSVLGRPQTHLFFNRFKLPALDSESENDDPEINNIFEGLPKRLTNLSSPTEAENQSGQKAKSQVDTPIPAAEYEAIYDLKEDNVDTTSQSRCESRLTLRDFVKMPWRSMSACLPEPYQQTTHEYRESSSSRVSGFPVPSRRPPLPQRPITSFGRSAPPPGVFGGRKVLPTTWMKNPTLQIGKGAAFSRSNVIMCPSKLSADVTYLRRV